MRHRRERQLIKSIITIIDQLAQMTTNYQKPERTILEDFHKTLAVFKKQSDPIHHDQYQQEFMEKIDIV